ncbi:hypothetical protein GGF46_003967 [Coemansia sp. RSA 552]|nr:hypothetical protein GGF46_003967 [Coemansia sp. RSA 552]
MSATVVTSQPAIRLGQNTGARSLLQTAASSVKLLLHTTDGSRRGNIGHPMGPTPLPSIEAFVASVAQTLKASPVVVVTSLIYVERLSKRLPQSATGKADTPYRIFLVSLLLADKFWSDRAMGVKALVAATGGLFRHAEILAMEKALLRIIGFDLFVSAAHIRRFARALGIEIDATIPPL